MADITYIYFLEAGKDGPIKIGFAKDVRKRVKDMQSGNHLPLNVILEIPGDYLNEGQFHDLFARHNIRGEWFQRHQDILEVIEMLTVRKYLTLTKWLGTKLRQMDAESERIEKIERKEKAAALQAARKAERHALR